MKELKQKTETKDSNKVNITTVLEEIKVVNKGSRLILVRIFGFFRKEKK